MSIGERVRKARKEKKMTQAQLASRVGITQSTLSELENGDSASTGYIASIAAALDVSPLWLESGRGPEKPELRVITNYDKELEQAIRLLQLFNASTPGGRELILDAALHAEKIPGAVEAGAAGNDKP